MEQDYASISPLINHQAKLRPTGVNPWFIILALSIALGLMICLSVFAARRCQQAQVESHAWQYLYTNTLYHSAK